VTFTVSRNPSTTTVGEVRPAIAAVGEDVEVDLEVTPVPAGGTVQVAVDGTPVGAPLALDGSGRATATLTGLAVGDHTVTADYSGDGDLFPSSTSTSLTVHTVNEAFVRRAFEVVLGRPADPGGVAYWLSVLDGGATTHQVVARMARTPEGRALVVARRYVDVMGRAADADGRAYWAGRLAGDMTVEELTATLLASAEAYQRSGGDPEGLALTLFRVHLGRAASTADLAYWRSRIAAADTPAGRYRIALRFGRTPEATRVAVRTALVAACGSPSATDDQIQTLTDRWATWGRDPVWLAGGALALVCPPGA